MEHVCCHWASQAKQASKPAPIPPGQDPVSVGHEEGQQVGVRGRGEHKTAVARLTDTSLETAVDCGHVGYSNDTRTL